MAAKPLVIKAYELAVAAQADIAAIESKKVADKAVFNEIAAKLKNAAIDNQLVVDELEAE